MGQEGQCLTAVGGSPRQGPWPCHQNVMSGQHRGLTLLMPKQSQCPAIPLDTEHGTLPEVGGWLEHTQHLLTDQTAEQRTEGRPEIFKSLPTLQKLSP